MSSLTVLQQINRKLDHYRLPTITTGSNTYQVVSWAVHRSARPDKRFKLVAQLEDQKTGKLVQRTVHFGSPEHNTFLDHGDTVRRENFSAMIERTKDNPLSPMWLSATLLW